MSTSVSRWYETMQKRKSLFGSLTDRRRSQRSLVYDVRKAESVSSSDSTDPIEDKLDKLSDDLQSLQNTLRAVAHRVLDLEKVISEKQNEIQVVQEDVEHEDQPQTPPPPPPPFENKSSTAQQKSEKTADTSLKRRRKPDKNDLNRNIEPLISDKLTTKPRKISMTSTTTPATKRSRYDLDSAIKHELYRTVPKLVVDCCNLIEDHASIGPFERLYFQMADAEEIKTILKNCEENNDYKCLDSVKSIYIIAGVLKAFFLQIKYPIITMSEIQAFLGSSSLKWEISSNSERIDTMQKLMKSLPEVNRDTLKYFVRHLKRLCRDYPKQINSREIAASIAPSMLQLSRRKPRSSQELSENFDYLITYIKFMIDQCDSIFKINHRTKFQKTLERCISCPGLFNL